MADQLKPKLVEDKHLELEIEWNHNLDKLTLQQRLVQKVLHHHKFLDFGPPPPRSVLALPARRWPTGRLYAAAVAIFFTLGAVITTLGLLHKV